MPNKTLLCDSDRVTPVQCGLNLLFLEACRNYYAEVWVRHADWKEAEFFDELPAHLRGEVAAFLMQEVFQQSDFFRCLPEDICFSHMQEAPLAWACLHLLLLFIFLQHHLLRSMFMG